MCEDDEEETPNIKEVKMVIIEGVQYVWYSDPRLASIVEKIRVSSIDHVGPFIDLVK